MNSDINTLRDKLARAIDPNDPYTHDEFMNEYGYNSYEYDTDLPFFINLNFVNKSENPDPEYATPGSSGFDLRASESKTIEPGSYEIISTGLFFDIPDNFEIQIRSRSGLSAKHGVAVLNSPGTIDSDYKNEIKIILINHGKQPFNVEVGDRIAQGVIAQSSTAYVKLNKVHKILDNTQRNGGGFGSTGIK
jgi:dUTP pyrophosphatase